MMMNRVELVVRTLVGALQGHLPIHAQGAMACHGYIPTTIGDLEIRFWARTEITRVAMVRYPDGAAIDFERLALIPDPWLPPRDEFADWWALMGDTAVSEEKLTEELHQTWDHYARNEAWFDLIYRANARRALYQPWSYLTEQQQDALEMEMRFACARFALDPLLLQSPQVTARAISHLTDEEAARVLTHAIQYVVSEAHWLRLRPLIDDMTAQDLVEQGRFATVVATLRRHSDREGNQNNDR